jgi:hypothetical protein
MRERKRFTKIGLRCNRGYIEERSLIVVNVENRNIRDALNCLARASRPFTSSSLDAELPGYVQNQIVFIP